MTKRELKKRILEHKFSSNKHKKELIFDIGFLLSLGFSKIDSYAKDTESKNKLNEMMAIIRKTPLLNGMTYFDIIENIDKLNDKFLEASLTQGINLLNYAEPRIMRYAKDTSNDERDIKHIWLDRIRLLKDISINIL